MSEAELHFIRARLQGGILSKARRGELPMPLPVGLITDPTGKVVPDPDQAVQDAIRHLFGRPPNPACLTSYGGRTRGCVSWLYGA
jgi:DNA invertase Pin-like site-specific DNA recombinase